MENSWSLAAAKFLSATLVLAVTSVLLKPIIWPVILRFPWEEKHGKEEEVVILAGSYNPPHRGHLAMLEYLSKRYKRVIAVVGFNPYKKYLVSPEQRVDLLREMLKNTSATNVQVEVVQGYIWRFAKRQGATIFFRGIRSWEKDGTDERSLQILNTWGPLLLGPLFWPIPTIYLEGNPKYNHVSSTLIRDICKEGIDDNNNNNSNAKEALTELVPANVTDLVAKLYCAKPPS